MAGDDVAGGGSAGGFMLCLVRAAVAEGVGRRRLTRGLQIIENGLVLVEADGAGVGADESLIEDAARSWLNFSSSSACNMRADFGGGRNLIEGDFAFLTLEPEFFAKGGQ